jgi:hypothetical protein
MDAIQIVADLLLLGSQQAATVNDHIVVSYNIPNFVRESSRDVLNCAPVLKVSQEWATQNLDGSVPLAV